MRTNDFGQPVGDPVQRLEISAPGRTPMEGHFCRVVPLDASAHREDLFRAFSAATDEGDWTYLPYGPFSDITEFGTWLESVAELEDPMFFSVISEKSGLSVGLSSFLRIKPAEASIEVGHIHLSRTLQRTPAATEAMYLMMKRAFDTGYRRYEWKCDDLNGPSRAAAARLGFQYEGTFRKATHYKGRNRDTAWFGIVDDDWPTLRAEFERWLDLDNFDADGQQLSPLGHQR